MNLPPRTTGLAALALFVSMLATTTASADTLKLDYSPNHSSGFPGGAFRASNIVGGPLAGTSFDTFCLETGEFFTPGGTYNYAVNYAAVQGGQGAGGSDPISLGTAYLYNSYLQSGGDSKIVQQAIWWLEDEATTGEERCLTGSACQALLAQVASTLQKSSTTDLKVNCGSQCYGVVALNLTDGSGGRAQDQLGRVPEAGATLLLAMSLAGLAWRARRRNVLGLSSAQIGSLA